jgi:hypothetical protein
MSMAILSVICIVSVLLLVTRKELQASNRMTRSISYGALFLGAVMWVYLFGLDRPVYFTELLTVLLNRFVPFSQLEGGY